MLFLKVSGLTKKSWKGGFGEGSSKDMLLFFESPGLTKKKTKRAYDIISPLLLYICMEIESGGCQPEKQQHSYT